MIILPNLEIIPIFIEEVLAVVSGVVVHVQTDMHFIIDAARLEMGKRNQREHLLVGTIHAVGDLSTYTSIPSL